MKKSSTALCARAVSLFRGLYARVAHRLGVDVSYISRVARGERKSKGAEKALAKEFNKAVSAMKNSSVLCGEKPYMVVALRCPLCKTPQKVHIDARPGFTKGRSDRVTCINCSHHFRVTIPEKIIRGPFPA